MPVVGNISRFLSKLIGRIQTYNKLGVARGLWVMARLISRITQKLRTQKLRTQKLRTQRRRTQLLSVV